MHAFDHLGEWPVDNVAAAVLTPDEPARLAGDVDRRFELASVTKLLTAMVALVAHEEGTLGLDDRLTTEDATTADLLSHAAGFGPTGREHLSAPHRRRTYSTGAYELVADAIGERAEMSFADYLREAVLRPLDMAATTLDGSAGAEATSTVRDLIALVDAWRRPGLVARATLDRATTPHRPLLTGVLPGYGRQDPNPWGLGPEIRGHKHPHWTGATNSPRTYGHFGQAGTFVWIDPAADVAAVVLTDHPWGDWALDRWPAFSDAVLSELRPAD